MAKCCYNIFLNGLTGTPPVLDGGGEEPPVLSDYCVQWAQIPGSDFWACLGTADVNGWTSQTEICGGTFTISDFVDTGNTFLYDAAPIGAGGVYAQVLRPIANAALVDLGYYSYEFLAIPFGPYPIDITNSNCYVNCYTATFDVDDVSVNGFTGGATQIGGKSFDLTVLETFDSPTAGADYLSQMISLNVLEPSATFEVTVNSPTNVTLTICTIMTMINGNWGTSGGDLGGFNFTLV